MNSFQKQFLQSTAAEAKKAAHIFPDMAACEAALESGYGASELAREANNLFGMKWHRHAAYGKMVLPTREFENSEWIQISADWEKYPDNASCFADRMSTLMRLSPYLDHYRRAVNAQDARSYVIQVSESWSTDPGFECTCCSMFQSEADAQAHARDNPADADHAKISMLPGLGRALKVLAIYDAIAGDWNATA
jgi:flagellum-specific peptidoglycan hydrolase FlgJ